MVLYSTKPEDVFTLGPAVVGGQLTSLKPMSILVRSLVRSNVYSLTEIKAACHLFGLTREGNVRYSETVVKIIESLKDKEGFPVLG